MCDNSIQIATDKKNEQLKQIKKQNKFRQKLHKKWQFLTKYLNKD